MEKSELKVLKDTSYRVEKPEEKSKKKFDKRLIAVALVAVMILGVIITPIMRARAAFDPSSAIKYKDYRAKNEIENSTLFIGTYLISLYALTDELFAEADESATESEQTTRYYYSELADGAWRNISDATSLDDLGPNSGVAVSEDELADLYITKVIGADGVVKDALTGQVIGGFDDPDPYDLYHLPEFASLRKAYAGDENAEEPSLSTYMKMRGQTVTSVLLVGDSYEEGEKVERSVAMDTFVYNAFHDFFAQNVKNDLTNQCDRQLASLQTLYNDLKAAGEDERADAVYTLMGKVDSTRRAEVFRQLTQEPDPLMTTLEDKIFDGVGYSGSNFISSLAETEGYASSEEQAENAYYDNLSNALTEDSSTILGRFEYEYSMDVINTASRESIDALVDLYHIRDGIVANQASELDRIENDFLPEADRAYSNAITSGVTSDYRAVASSSGAMAAASILTDQLTSMEDARSELEFLIDAKRKRMEAADALDYIFERIDWADELYDRIKKDNAQENATYVNDEHIAWLRDVVEQILAENESLRSQMQQLQGDLNDLETEKQMCLDNNDLQGAKQKDAEISEIKKKIDEEAKKLNAIINAENTSEKEKEQAKAALGAGEDKLIDSLYNAALTALGEGDTNRLEAAAGGLGALGASDAINQLLNRLDSMSGSGSGTGDGSDSGANSGTSTGLSNADLNAMKNLLDEAAEDATDGGTGNGSDLSSVNGLNNALEDFFGGSLSSLSPEQLAAALTAFAMLGNDGNTVCASYAAQIARSHRSDLIYLYDQYLSDRNREYVSLKTIGDVTNYRYIYYQSTHETTMTGMGSALTFTSGLDVVKNADGQRKSLSAKAVRQDVVYAVEEDATLYFSCEEEPVPQTQIAICVTPTVKEEALAFVEYLSGLL